MDKEEVRGIIHSAVYRIVRQLDPIPVDNFFDKTIKETVPQGGTPSGWEDFWWESLAAEIQNAFISRKMYILGLTAKWLKERRDGKWENLISHLDDNLGPFK